MTVESRTISAPSFDIVKMDERKRPVMSDHDDGAPPLKKQVTSINGAKAQNDADMPWKDEIESFQKDAILRQMKEYKREKGMLDHQLRDLEKKSLYHDDHIRIIDTWFSQLIDEIRILIADLPEPNNSPPNNDDLNFDSSLLVSENDKFQEHLKNRSEKIKTSVSALFKKIPAAATSPPEFRDLQERLSKLLASEKAHIVELQKVQSEKEQLSERLDTASLRYVLAEKKLDRVRSAAVARLEKQATQGGALVADDVSKKDNQPAINGTSDKITNEDSESARREAVAVAETRANQLEEMEQSNKKLTEELTTLHFKLRSLSDEDYAKTDLFKLLKSQHEDVIKRINNLEATNIQLREESQRLQAERSAYRSQMDEESRTLIGEIESQLARAETDLARIRNSRDELVADLAIKKSSLNQQKLTLEQTKELATARESRIAALETEVERLQAQTALVTAADGDKTGDSAAEADLRAKVISLEKECALLHNELPSIERAWKKAQALAAKKVDEVAKWEEQIARLTAEKAKADQKYFGAMKAKEAREVEIRAIRSQNSKTSDIVSQLKEAEGTCRALIANLEKQLSETKETMAEMSSQQRTLQQRVTELTITSEGLAVQNNDLKKLLGVKDAAVADAEHTKRQIEVEAEELKVRYEEAKKNLESWKKKRLGGNADEYEALRKIAICTVCNKNFKNTAIKSCGHVFCNECVEERITSRSRKCPNCGKSFGANDHMRVTL